MSTPLQIDLEVLSAVHEATKLGTKISVAAVCNKLDHMKKLTKVSITRMKEAGMLRGERGISITQEGIDALGTLAEKSPHAPPVQPEVVTAQETPRTAEDRKMGLSESMAERYLVSPEQLYRTIARNIISIHKKDPDPVTPEEVFIVMSICAQYDLNPMLKQVHAFRHKGKLQVPVGVDGWIWIANRDKRFIGVEYEYPDVKEMVKKGNKMVWPWVKATCHMKERVPCSAYAFIDEWWTGDNWGAHPCHRLKQKAFTMVIREALGIALPDDEDAHQMRHSGEQQAMLATSKTQELLGTMKDALTGMDKAPMTELPASPLPLPPGVDGELLAKLTKTGIETPVEGEQNE